MIVRFKIMKAVSAPKLTQLEMAAIPRLLKITTKTMESAPMKMAAT